MAYSLIARRFSFDSAYPSLLVCLLGLLHRLRIGELVYIATAIAFQGLCSNTKGGTAKEQGIAG
jgi:hypothetical protein